MTETTTTSLVHQYAAMKPTEFGKNIEPKWQVAGKLVKQVQDGVEQKFLTPLDGARLISAITASLFAALDGVVDPGVGNWHFPYFNDELGEAVGGTHDLLLLHQRRALDAGGVPAVHGHLLRAVRQALG